MITASELQIAKDMGVDCAIHIDDVEDPVEEVMKITGGRGVDYAIEAVGSVKTYEQAFAMLRRVDSSLLSASPVSRTR